MATDSRTLLVLVVDDDTSMRMLCRGALEPLYRTIEASNGADALRQLYQNRPDLVLLDVGMPVMDGWETCRRVRDISDTPVIMLTARDAEHDVARGLDSGADDYVVKPFSPIELLARIRAVLRRRSQALPASNELMSFDDGRLVVDPARRLAIARGEEVTLSATEYKLLEVLARHAGQVLSHEQILEHVWGPAYAGESGYVKTYVGLLRNKIEADPRNPEYILARRGLGYYLEKRGRRSHD
ncbi:MAG: response regulator transcription factor [Chloroflexi bacterium]|nr:response regulator transcription factor [Chloroflexota bacterium]